MSSDSLGRSSTIGQRFVGALVVALALTLLSSLTVTASQAATRRAVSVSRTVVGSTVLTGDGASVSGRVSVAPPGARVALQRLVGRTWRTVKSERLTSLRTYRFAIATRVAGAARYRVYSPADTRRLAGASSSFVVNVLACAPGTPPTRGAAAWFGRPFMRTANPIVSNLARLFCSAARGARINIAMYFVTSPMDRSAVGQLMVPLQRVARYRGVKVRFILEGKLYGQGAPLASSVPVLRRFAAVTLCHAGCHNERAATAPGNGITHHKYVTVSDMAWSRGVDPAVVMSSANWSESQLHRFWQSAVLIYDDDALFKQFDVESETMVACAVNGCASWAARMGQLGLSPQTYGLRDQYGLWYDVAPHERSGDASRGRGVTFSPWSGRDPLATALRGYTCTPEHRTVRVAHMFITSGRQAVIDALAALQAQGCDVKIVLRQLPGTPEQDGVKRLRAAGLPVGCLLRVHDKVVLVDAVRTSHGRPDRALWMGSQSLGLSALRSNDEALLRASTADATNSMARYANSAMFGGFMNHFDAMYRLRERCG